MIEENEEVFTTHDLDRFIKRAESEACKIIEDGMRVILNIEHANCSQTVEWLKKARSYLHDRGRLPNFRGCGNCTFCKKSSGELSCTNVSYPFGLTWANNYCDKWEARE